ncbi:hypothetical protein V1264_023708 [Littorina saxatilis]|uniref:Uncharacterized protein n=1 Tax=Littorina saxatilis TaxID=31220 RepID=A0AAN9B8G7_9CAEN
MEDTEKEQLFTRRLFEHYEKDGRKLLPKAVYFRTIEEVKAAFQKTTKSRHEYHLWGKFEVLKCGDIERLVQKRTDTTEESILYYATLEKTYDIVKRAHMWPQAMAVVIAWRRSCTRNTTTYHATR